MLNLPRAMIVVLVLLVLPAASAQQADTTQAERQAAVYLGVAEQWHVLLGQQNEEAPVLPRITDPVVAELFAVLTDSKRFLVDLSHDRATLGSLMKTCSAANRIVMRYVMHDVSGGLAAAGVSPGSASAETNRQVRRIIGRNAGRYHPELSLLQPFLLNCAATQIPLLNQFVDAQSPAQLTNMRRAGFTRTRARLFSTYYGFLQMAASVDVPGDYRRVLLSALDKTAPAFASALRPLDRRRIREELELQQGQSPNALAGYLAGIAAAVSSPVCTGLCRY